MGRNWTVLGSRGHKDRHASVAAFYYLRLRASLEVSRCRAHAPRALALRGLPAICKLLGSDPAYFDVTITMAEDLAFPAASYASPEAGRPGCLARELSKRSCTASL